MQQKKNRKQSQNVFSVFTLCLMANRTQSSRSWNSICSAKQSANDEKKRQWEGRFAVWHFFLFPFTYLYIIYKINVQISIKYGKECAGGNIVINSRMTNFSYLAGERHFTAAYATQSQTFEMMYDTRERHFSGHFAALSSTSLRRFFSSPPEKQRRNPIAALRYYFINNFVNPIRIYTPINTSSYYTLIANTKSTDTRRQTLLAVYVHCSSQSQFFFSSFDGAGVAILSASS